MQSDYDPTKPSTYITYLDANNLYGWAMSKDLPTGEFCWVSEEEIDLTKKSNKGLILEVDLDYPEHLHDKHNNYPLAPERLEIKSHMLSDHCKKFNIL